MRKFIAIILLLSINLSVFQDYFEKLSEVSCELVDIEDDESKKEIEDSDKFISIEKLELNTHFNHISEKNCFIFNDLYFNQSELTIQNPPPESTF